MMHETHNTGAVPKTEEEEGLLTADIPEKFKDPETGGVKLDLLAKSYKALEQKLSGQPKPPQSAEEYCIECSHGMFEPDADINSRLHAKGFTQDQAQEVYNIAADKMIPMMREMAMDYKADREVEKLVNHFGGVQNWREVSRQLLSFGQKNLPDDVLDNLSSSYEGVLALHRMMKNGEPNLQRGASKTAGALDEAELNSMMRDPKYWRDKDPAYISKVTQGFENLYRN